MANKDLTIERVVAVVRERGPMRNSELQAHFGLHSKAGYSRELDGLLQKARKSGLLHVESGRWVSAAVEAAEHESAARVAEERIARIADAMDAAALYVGHRTVCGVHADPMAACDCGYGAVWERYAAALREVKP